MRVQLILLIILTTYCARAQQPSTVDQQTPIIYKGANWHSGFGLAFGTVNFKENGNGALAIPIRYDFLNIGDASFSLGTNIKIGTEDRYGLSFPVLLILLVIAGAVDNSSAWADIGGNGNDDGKGYGIGFFTDLPLLIHYNVGLGTREGQYERIGYYVGGGFSYTLTGYTLYKTVQQSTHFFGWVGNAGVRLRNGVDLGFSLTLPRNNPVGPIQNPVFYQLTFCSFNPYHPLHGVHHLISEIP